MTTRQFCGFTVYFARQFAKGNDGPRKGHGTDKHAQENLNLKDCDFCGIFMRQFFGKPCNALVFEPDINTFAAQGGWCLGHQRFDRTQFDKGVKADENSRQPNKAVQRSNQLRHFGHFNLARNLLARKGANGHSDQNDQIIAHTGAKDRGSHSQTHADNAVPYGALCAFLSAKPTQREDEQDCSRDIGCGNDSDFHKFIPRLMISGT